MVDWCRESREVKRWESVHEPCKRDQTLGTCKAAYTPEYSMFWNVSASGSVETDGTQEGGNNIRGV